MKSTEAIRNFVPKKGNLVSDLLAGLTFAMVNIPQSMAQALLAFVNPVYGLYTLMLATPVAAIFTGSVFMNVSTTSALSVAAGDTLSTYSADDRTTVLITLVFMIGIFQVVMGLLRMGWIARFIPFSVMTGFMTGVAILMIIGQLGSFTGYVSSYSGKLRQVGDLILHWQSISWTTLLVGLLTLLLVYLLNLTRLSKFSLVLALLIASIATSLLNQFLTVDVQQVKNISEVPSSLPRPALPNPALVLDLLWPAVAVGIIGLVQGAGVSQTFPNPDGKFSDISRDFFGQGIANMVGGFFGGIPAGGSSSGTAVIVSAGARSRWANIFAGLAVMFLVLMFANLVELIAMPALAGLIIVAGVQMINDNAIRTVWNTNIVSRTVMAITFASTLVMPLQYAVLLGVIIAILLFVFQQANTLRVVEWDVREPGWPVEKPAPKKLEPNKITVLYIYGNLFYATMDTFEKSLPATEDAQGAVVILLMRGYEDVGSTVFSAIRRYTETLQVEEGKLILAGVSPTLKYQLQQTGILYLIGEENIFPATQTIGEAANAALQSARKWQMKE